MYGKSKKTYLILAFGLMVCSILTVSCRKNKPQKEETHYTYNEHKQRLQYFHTKDGKMAYLDVGDGQVILLVHGVPTSSWLYRKLAPRLSEQGFRVVVPDMLGYGAGNKPDDPNLYSPEKMGQRLLELMEHLKIEGWTQVFHDGGGLWTWEMLRRDATKVNQLIMLNTIVYESGFKPPMRFEEGEVAKVYIKQYTTAMGQKMVINSTFSNGISNKEVINPTMMQGYEEPFRSQSAAALYYFFTRTCNNIPDYTELHQSLNIPLSVIWGEEDDVLVWNDIANEVKANFDLKEENIHIIDGKHFIQEEQPELISKLITITLNKQSANTF